MKIEEIEPVPLAYAEPNDHGGTRHVCLVRIRSDDGASGWGEAVTIWPEASRATAEIVRGLAGLLVGRDPLRTGALWQLVREHTWWYGVGGIATFAHAAVDMALWDLRGRATGQRVVDMLGGPVHEELPAVVSCHAARGDLAEGAAEIASWVAAERARGVKVGFGKRGDAHLGFDFDRDVEFMRLLRGALGPAPLVMIDLGVRNSWTVADAIRRVNALSEHGLHWVEEPLGADNPEGYARLQATTSTLIAYGEREWTVRGVQKILATGTVDVVGVDPGRAEGITGFARACRLAADADRQANAHAWAGPIAYAAALAVSHASHACRQFEVQPLINPLHRDLARAPRPAGGVMPEPAGPGLGIEVDEAAVDHYRIDT
ncbi:MAG TPA: mandelate racemase/muconate lactonizing enzyme family protein [Streptosporangiaceae bacterium]